MSVQKLDPTEEEVAFTVAAGRPRPLGNSLSASAQRLTKETISRIGNKGKAEAWQDDAWDMYDLIGEQRFLSNTLANRMSQARFYIGKLPENTTEDIEPLTEGPAYEVGQSLLGNGMNFQQVAQRAGVNLSIPGDGYLIGCPNKDPEPKPDSYDGITPIGETEDPLTGVDINDLEWKFRSVSEVEFKEGDVHIKMSGSHSKKYHADDVVIIRVWRSHPRRWWDADSPTRSSLPVLRELVGLTMHISAQLDSRLAGAGVFFIPSSADQAMRAALGASDEQDTSPLADALMLTMTTAINDRASASALTPIMPVVPDESIEHFRFVSFATPLDAEARPLREESIRRMALGQDCPPELLLGVAGMNHWGAWLVREDVVTTHLEPPLAILCDAITTQFLWPVLELQGVENFKDYVMWYDVEHLILRPNRSADAVKAREMGLIGDPTARDALGFDETDAPAIIPTDPVLELVLSMIRTAPSLAQAPGISVLAEQIRAMMDGRVEPLPGAEVVGETEEAEETIPAEEGGVPATEDEGPADV